MKIMLLACLPAFLRACVREIRISVCACRKVKKKRDPEDPEKRTPKPFVACSPWLARKISRQVGGKRRLEFFL